MQGQTCCGCVWDSMSPLFIKTIQTADLKQINTAVIHCENNTPVTLQAIHCNTNVMVMTDRHHGKFARLATVAKKKGDLFD